MEKRSFFWAAMAGLGKYYMGGYGRIGVYIKVIIMNINFAGVYHQFGCISHFYVSLL